MGTSIIFLLLNPKSISLAKIASLAIYVPTRPGCLHVTLPCHNLSVQTHSYICVYNLTQQDQYVNQHLNQKGGSERQTSPKQVNCRMLPILLLSQ